MNQKTVRIIFPALIAITLFSLWAGFALLIVNKLFYKDLPGYTIGRICIWEFVAIVIAGLIARALINKWGNIEVKEIENTKYLTMNPKFGIYFGVYFLIAILVAIWQFWIFSQKF
jgi:hypothetical protein